MYCISTRESSSRSGVLCETKCRQSVPKQVVLLLILTKHIHDLFQTLSLQLTKVLSNAPHVFKRHCGRKSKHIAHTDIKASE